MADDSFLSLYNGFTRSFDPEMDKAPVEPLTEAERMELFDKLHSRIESAYVSRIISSKQLNGDEINDLKSEAVIFLHNILSKFDKSKCGAIGDKDVPGKDQPKTLAWYFLAWAQGRVNWAAQDNRKRQRRLVGAEDLNAIKKRLEQREKELDENLKEQSLIGPAAEKAAKIAGKGKKLSHEQASVLSRMQDLFARSEELGSEIATLRAKVDNPVDGVSETNFEIEDGFQPHTSPETSEDHDTVVQWLKHLPYDVREIIVEKLGNDVPSNLISKKEANLIAPYIRALARILKSSNNGDFLPKYLDIFRPHGVVRKVVAMKLNVQNFLKSHGHACTKASGGTHVTLDSCPMCKKSKKFYIELKSGLYICHNCRADNTDHCMGGPVGLVMLIAGVSFPEATKIVYGRSELTAAELNEVKHKEKFFDFLFEEEESVQEEDLKVLKLPKCFERLNEDKHPEHYRYLTKVRGLSPDDISKTEILAIAEPDFRKVRAELTRSGMMLDEANEYAGYVNRVIWPIRKGSRVVGLIGRSIEKRPYLKTRNSTGPFRRFSIWNLDHVRDSELVVLTESILNAYNCGLDRSCATFGVHVSDEQIELLLRLPKTTKVVIAFDPDANIAGKNAKEPLTETLRKKLSLHFEFVKVLELPKVKNEEGKYLDANDYTKEQMDRFILDCVAGEAIEKKLNPLDGI
nr:hypothetical protein BdHM001_35310 [Bdellovibrio sp. HM001]